MKFNLRHNILPTVALIVTLLGNIAWADEPSPATFGESLENETTTTGQGFAVVELFTSQGCSSCPSADENLMRIHRIAAAEGLPIYVLSFHVDYWNNLGWEDPFSGQRASQRQRQYARNFRSTRVYTPQMIVNGQAEFVGSNQALSNKAIVIALRSQAAGTVDAKLAIDKAKRTIDVQLAALSLPAGGHVNIALVQKHGARTADAGENRGRHLQHVNIVRNFKTVDPSTSQTIPLPLPTTTDRSDFHVLVYAQAREGQILAARRIELPK